MNCQRLKRTKFAFFAKTGKKRIKFFMGELVFFVPESYIDNFKNNKK